MKRKEKNEKKLWTGLGLEWLFPILHYYQVTDSHERFWDKALPLLLAVGITISCGIKGAINHSVFRMSDILIGVVSVLIGFSIMLVTLLITSDSECVKELKDRKIHEKRINNDEVSLFQKLHIIFSNSLVNEIFLVLSVFLYFYLHSVLEFDSLNAVILVFYIFETLSILFSILRGVTYIYFSFMPHLKKR